MKNCTQFSAHGSLVLVGVMMRKMNIWKTIEEKVTIKQKIYQHTPHEKLLDAFINIIAGGQGIVEINTRVRPDTVLQKAFGRERCADQSTVSTTINACNEETVHQMRQALNDLYQHHGKGYRHDYRQRPNLLDVDTTGMPAGRQGEGVTKGFFSGNKGRRGRQLGRVTATLYDEIVIDRLYPGNEQLKHSLQELVMAAENSLEMTAAKRQATIVRVDGGGGRDADINWLLDRGYMVMAKVWNWKRATKLAKSVREWHDDPKVPGRQMGWVELPHAYTKPTRQLVIRKPNKAGKLQLRAVVFNLDDAALFFLDNKALPKQPSQIDILLTAVHAYDRRGGGVETSIKGSKSGLGLSKRNKRSFYAQEMLVLLALLAYNLIVWLRDLMAKHVPTWKKYGILRMVRDVFHISGCVELNSRGHPRAISLNRNHGLADKFLEAFSNLLADDDLLLNLREI